MNETLKTEESIREYLLGRATDDARLAEYEELLFSDNEFCGLVEVTEDSLTNDHVFGRLSAKDEIDFVKTLENNSERRSKVALTRALKVKAAEQPVAIAQSSPAFFESLRTFFSQPMYAGGFALLLIAAVVGSFLLLSSSQTDELANLKEVYKKERSVEPRIAGFDYAPLVVTRGETEEREKNKLRRIENELILGTENSPSALTHRALGVFYLTQRKFDDAIDQLEKAAKLDKANAVILNDLGSAYFEKSKAEPQEKKLQTLAKALENFSQAVNSNPNLLEALFNKALCLQELRLDNQASQAWNDYLSKDNTSAWAVEARKNLERLEQIKSSAKTKEQVLDDFLNAYRLRDEETVWKINSQTKEMISGVWLPDQLTRKFLEAKIRGDDVGASEFIKALTYIGDLEKEKNADFFVAQIGEYLGSVRGSQLPDLLEAKDLSNAANKLILDRKYTQASEYLLRSRQIDDRNQNFTGREIADYWLSFCKRATGRLQESFDDYSKQLKRVGKSRFFETRILTTQGEISFQMNRLNLATALWRKSQEMSRDSNDLLSIDKNASNLGVVYQTYGEIERSQTYLAEPILRRSERYESRLQRLRNLWYSSSIFNDASAPYVAALFGEEALSLAIEDPGDLGTIFDSTLDLATCYLPLGNYQRAAELASQNLNLAQKFSEEDAKNFALAYSHLQLAHINRLTHNYDFSVSQYDEAIKRFVKDSEYKIDNFVAHKGRLLCLMKLNREADVEAEIAVVKSLFEKYRTEILLEESRNTFFDRQQQVSNITAEYFLEHGDARRAFDYIEGAKARSLLDMIESNGVYDPVKGQIVFANSAKPLTIDETQSRLDPSFQIVEFALLEDQIAVWIVTTERFEVELIPISAKDLDQKIKNYLSAVADRSSEERDIAKELYNLLIKPISSKLDSTKELCIIPDGILHNLPFAALISDTTNKYLIEDFTVSYAPSATLAVMLSEKAKTKTGEELLVVGNPAFNHQTYPTLPPLTSAETEAKATAELYTKSTSIIGSQATKNVLLEHLREVAVFHFAGHYVSNQASYLFSKLILSDSPENADPFSGELRSAEILQKKDIHLKLAILSACETGVEKFYNGEGAIGMARTFLSIGTPKVVASQWKVDSEATSQLMIDFHKNRTLRKLNTSEALRQAQIAMIRSKDKGEPYYWAAFAAIGGKTHY